MEEVNFIKTPNGGFPPIYHCKNKINTNNDEQTKRQYGINNKMVSIRNLLEKRK